MAALSAAENIKKNGICMVPIRMAVLFSGTLYRNIIPLPDLD